MPEEIMDYEIIAVHATVHNECRKYIRFVAKFTNHSTWLQLAQNKKFLKNIKLKDNW